MANDSVSGVEARYSRLGLSRMPASASTPAAPFPLIATPSRYRNHAVPAKAADETMLPASPVFHRKSLTAKGAASR